MITRFELLTTIHKCLICVPSLPDEYSKIQISTEFIIPLRMQSIDQNFKHLFTPHLLVNSPKTKIKWQNSQKINLETIVRILGQFILKQYQNVDSTELTIHLFLSI